jgi:hypothetical protein
MTVMVNYRGDTWAIHLVRKAHKRCIFLFLRGDRLLIREGFPLILADDSKAMVAARLLVDVC